MVRKLDTMLVADGVTLVCRTEGDHVEQSKVEIIVPHDQGKK